MASMFTILNKNVVVNFIDYAASFAKTSTM